MSKPNTLLRSVFCCMILFCTACGAQHGQTASEISPKISSAAETAESDISAELTHTNLTQISQTVTYTQSTPETTVSQTEPTTDHTAEQTTEAQTEAPAETTESAPVTTVSKTVSTTVHTALTVTETTSAPVQPTLSDSDLAEAAADSVTRLMITAHPDDETIWGGAHLLEGGYLVLCLTNGDNAVRAEEFRQAVTQSGNIPLILHYPDQTDGVRDRWSSCLEQIRADIRFVLAQKHWELVVTHNPQGEYGHRHHKMVSRLTVQEFEHAPCADHLYFFEVYHSPAVLEETPEAFKPLPEDTLAAKQALCAVYASQTHTIRSLAHMLPYKSWTEYSP